MKSVPLREFQLHANEMLKELPIALTRYGETVCVVLPHKEYPVAPRENVSTVEVVETVQQDAKVLTDVLTQPAQVTTTPRNRNRCQFCGSIGATMHPYQYTDGSGEGEAMFCDPCREKYESSRRPASINYTPRPIMEGAKDLSGFQGSFPKPVKKKKGA